MNMINQYAQQNNSTTENLYRSEYGFSIPGYRSYIATTPEHYENAYRLRHEVYCKELLLTNVKQYRLKCTSYENKKYVYQK